MTIELHPRPILLLDFDGVLHSYTSGWQGARVVADPPVEGAMTALLNYMQHFQVIIYSSRSRQWGGRRAMKRWLKKHLEIHCYGVHDAAELPFVRDLTFSPATWAADIMKRLRWPIWKPAAFLTIDDRCMCFDGKWPGVQSLRDFKPWTKKGV